MQESWLKGYKDREARKKEVKDYRRAFQSLKEIIERDLKKKDAVRDYSPGWEYKQIAVNEYNQVIDDILKLINLED